MTPGRVHIGTSGWHYEHRIGSFYPPETKLSGFLRYYASRFATVEINSSFSRLPETKTLNAWREETPPGFLFAIKASRYLT